LKNYLGNAVPAVFTVLRLGKSEEFSELAKKHLESRPKK
jgi:hypothetical protein